MDRSRQYRFEPSPAVQCGGAFAVEFLLSAWGREPGESCRNATARRTVHAAAVLWCSTHDSVAGRPGAHRQSQTGTAIVTADGTGSDLSQTALVGSGTGTPD